jgi:hypothetical protein
VKRIAVCTVVVLSALVAAGCGMTVEEAEDRLCGDLKNLRADLAAVGDGDGIATVGEVKTFREELADGMRAVRDSARDVKDAKVDEMEDAWEDYDDALNDVEDDDSVAEALKKGGAAGDELVAAWQETAEAVECDVEM